MSLLPVAYLAWPRNHGEDGCRATLHRLNQLAIHRGQGDENKMKPWVRCPTPLSRAVICGVRPATSLPPSVLLNARHSSDFRRFDACPRPFRSRALSRHAVSLLWPRACRDWVNRRQQVRCATYQTTNTGPQGGPNLPFNEEEGEGGGDGKKGAKEKDGEGWGLTAFKMFESALTTFASIAILG